MVVVVRRTALEGRWRGGEVELTEESLPDDPTVLESSLSLLLVSVDTLLDVVDDSPFFSSSLGARTRVLRLRDMVDNLSRFVALAFFSAFSRARHHYGSATCTARETSCCFPSSLLFVWMHT
jgi:hypothetical protein